MSYVKDKETFFRLSEQMQTVLIRENRLPKQVFKEEFSEFRFIDLDELFTESFFNKLLAFLLLIGEREFVLYVLDPDPEGYFYKHFHQYSVLEFSAEINSAKDYTESLLTDPGDSPADAIRYNSNVFVLFSPSLRWAIYGERDIELGIAAFTEAGLAESFVDSYGSDRIFDSQSAVNELLPPVWAHSTDGIPKELSDGLINNYGRSGKK